MWRTDPASLKRVGRVDARGRQGWGGGDCVFLLPHSPLLPCWPPPLPLRMGSSPPSGVEVSVIFGVTLTAFQEVAWSFSPSPQNQASSRVWVWMRPGSLLPPPHTLQVRSSPRIRVDPSIISQPRALSSFSHSPPLQGTPRLRQSLGCGQKSLHPGLLGTSTRGEAPQVQVFTRADTVSNSYNLQSTGAHTHTLMNT